MMKGLVLALVVGLLCVPAGFVWAEEALSPEELKAELKASLMGTGFAIELTPKDGSDPLSDTVSFEGYKLSVASLAALGYPSSNYSLRLDGEGGYSFETMQVSEDLGKAFLRGDVDVNGVLTGVLNLEDKNGDVTGYTFKSL